MFKKINAIMYTAKVAKMIEEYKNAQTNGQKAIICLKANTLKSEAAHKVISDHLDAEVYRKLFKTKTADAYHNFLDLWLEEIENQKEAE